MRIAPTPQASQSAGEMPAKSTELENAPAGAFFAEIDRALNTGGAEEIPNEEKASEQRSEMSENNDLSLFLGACLFAMQPVKDPSGSCTSGPECADDESLDAAFPVKEESAPPSLSGPSKAHIINPDTEADENLFQNALLSLQPTADFAAQSPAAPTTGALSKSDLTEPNRENRVNLVERALFALQPSSDPSAPNQQGVAKNEPVFAQALDQNEKNALENKLQPGNIFQNTSIPNIDSEMEAKIAANSQYPDDQILISREEILRKITDENNNHILPDTKKQSPVIQESLSAGESLPVERLMTAGKNTSFQDSNTPKNESRLTGIFRNIENGGQGNSGEMDTRIANSVRAVPETMSMSGSYSDGANGNAETMDMDGSRSDPTTARNESSAWMALQSKLASPVVDPAKTKAAVSEHTQEQLVGMAAGLERPTGTNISATSPNAAAPSRPGELVYQIADRIQVQLRDGKNEIRIQLKPESLGSLEIRAEATGNGVIARITAESAAVKNYLENNLHILQQNLQDQGLKVDRIQIAVQEVVNQQSSSGQSAQFGHAASGGRQWNDPHSPARPDADLFSNPTEEIEVDPMTVIAAGSANRFHTVA
jgi:flagellar hook-length control protein FliK